MVKGTTVQSLFSSDAIRFPMGGKARRKRLLAKNGDPGHVLRIKSRAVQAKHMGYGNGTELPAKPTASPVLTRRAFFALQSVKARLCFRLFVIHCEAKSSRLIIIKKKHVPRTNLQHPQSAICFILLPPVCFI